MRHVLLDELGVFVINACQSAAGGCIEHHKMIGIRTDGGFILRHAFVCIDLADRTFPGAVHAPAHGVDCLDHRTT